MTEEQFEALKDLIRAIALSVVAGDRPGHNRMTEEAEDFSYQEMTARMSFGLPYGDSDV
jgi:hypothetical protein